MNKLENTTGNKGFIIMVALIVALGGFLMGFDASVISGVVKFIEIEFNLSKIELGWAVSSLTLSATTAMMVAGPLSDRYGRRRILRLAAILYAISAIGSALAPNFFVLVVARMVGGLGVGASLIIAPMYIAEISPSAMRGRMVSFNQLNIVLGISIAFFTNFLILQLGKSNASWTQSMMFNEYNWRWMLGLETLPALIYFFALFIVPRSPRWLAMKGNYTESLAILTKASGTIEARNIIANIKESINVEHKKEKQLGLGWLQKFRQALKELFQPSLKLVLVIGVVVAILQQITGINSVFFYAPMIFEQSGIGTDASFIQAIMVGLVNLAFTLLAISLIDKLGRKPLLIVGMFGIAISMMLLAYGFGQATYTLAANNLANLPEAISRVDIAPLLGQTFTDDISFKSAIYQAIGQDLGQQYESELITAAVSMNAMTILLGILGFVASFAVSVGPVMWVLFSELFPNWIRGLAISFVGLINSAVSFIVQLIFPWELATFGSSITFLIYGIFAIIGLFFIIKIVPETKGRSLEELEEMLVH